MKYRNLGRTDIQVSTVCLGCWSLIGDFTWGDQDEADSVAAIHASLDAGVNFFDTAEGYGGGRSEEMLGRELAGVRKSVVLATKVQPDHLRAADVRRSCEASLRRLRTDYIDLYQVHWPEANSPVAETMAALEGLKAEGKVRAIGISNCGVSYMGEFLQAGRIEANQLCYSLLWRPIEPAIQPMCVEQGVSILAYSPLCQGLLTGKFDSADEVPPSRARTRLFSAQRPHSMHREAGCEAEMFAAMLEMRPVCTSLGVAMADLALAWVLARPGVASVVAGARNDRQARINARAGDMQLPPDVVEKLAAITEKVKAYAGANPDLWKSDSRMDR